MVRVNRRLGRNVFWSILLFAIIFCTLFSGAAFCEETSLTQAESLFKAKKYDEAKALYQSVSQDSDSSLAIKGLTGVGRCEIQLGNTDAAEQIIETLKNDYSQHPNLCARLYDLSYEYWYKQDYANSKDQCQYIIQTFSDSTFAIKAQRGIVRCLIRQDEIAAAEQAADALINDYSGHEDLFRELNALSFEFLWKSDYEKCKSLWGYIADNTSDSTLALNSLAKIAQCEFITGNYAAVEQVIETLRNDYSGQEALYPELADIAGRYYKKQLFDKAAEHYQYIAQNNPSLKAAFKAQMRIVDCNIALEDSAGVQQAISSLLNDFADIPGHCNAIYSLANDYYKAGQYSNAETFYQFVIANSTDSDLAIRAATEAVSCKVASGNTVQAEQVLNTLKSSQSDHPKFYDSLFSLGE